jgi:hypothetical protein
MAKSGGNGGRSASNSVSSVGKSIADKRIGEVDRKMLGSGEISKIQNATQTTYTQLRNGVASGKITQSQVKDFAYDGLRHNLRIATGDLNGGLHQNTVTQMSWDIVSATYKR